MPDLLVDIIAIALLGVFGLNLVLLGYVQYGSRPVLRAIAASSAPESLRQVADEATRFRSRKRTRALGQVRRSSDFGELSSELRSRVQRYLLCVKVMYWTFGILVVVWLGGLVLSEAGLVSI